MFLIRHIYVSYPTYFLNDMFYSTTYYTKQHIFFNNIYMFFNNIWMFLNNIIMSYNIIGHMYVMHRFKTYMWSLCNIFLHLSTAITPFVALVVQWTCQFIVSSKNLNCSRFCSSSEMMFSTSYVHVPEGCCSAQHSEATPTSRVIHMFVCLCVRGAWDHYSLSQKKIALRTPSTRDQFESTHTDAGLVGVGGLVAWLEACVRIAGDFPQ